MESDRKIFNDESDDTRIEKNDPDTDGDIILEADSLIKQYKQYDTVVNAVNKVSLKIKKGEFTAIVGASGSGKSTLLHLLAGLDRPNAGTIKVNGQELNRMSPDELNRFRGNNIGVIFQNHNLIPHMTAIENIIVPTMMCGKEKVNYEENLRKLVSSLGIADRIHHLPSELSGGQQQRVAIARALINMPIMIFADEPTGNLDRKNADEVMELLLRTKDLLGQTLVMVTHDLSIAARADKVYKMDNGKISVVNTNSLAKEI